MRSVNPEDLPWLDSRRLLDPVGVGFPYTYDPRVSGSFQNLGAANRAIYARVVSGGTITKLGILVGTSSGNIDVGVYSNTGAGRAARPDVRMSSAGATACPAAGYAEVTLTAAVTVYAGDWLTISADNSTATFAAISSQGAVAITDGLQHYQDGAYPLPARAAVTGSGMRSVCLVGV